MWITGDRREVSNGDHAKTSLCIVKFKNWSRIKARRFRSAIPQGNNI